MNSKTTTTMFGIVALAALALLFASGQLVENQAFAYGHNHYHNNHHKHHHSHHYYNNHHKHHHHKHYHKYYKHN
jgi:hypothetical protein